MLLNQPWTKIPIIAIDTETSGQYPFESQLCEVAAIKYVNGEIIDTYQTLIKPTHKMSDRVIEIHNITNEMVADAPSVGSVIKDIHEFISDGVIIGHHSPFDLGFLTIEFEKYGLKLPKHPALCSSLLSIRLITDSPNHRLQTLIKHLKVDGGDAHRAFSDAKACYDVAVHCFRKVGMGASLNEIIKAQEQELFWKNFSIHELKSHPITKCLLEAVEKKQEVQITYQGGSRPGQARVVHPISIVRNPRGDFLVAIDENAGKDVRPKRYPIKKISHATF